MTAVSAQETQTNLEELLQRVARGEEFEIVVDDWTVARLVGIRPSGKRQFGHDRGRFEVPEDFDEPLPAEILAEFHGGIDP